MSLWRRPEVVRVPVSSLTAEEKTLYAAGILKEDPKHAYILWDGQHRLEFWKATYGTALIECDVKDVKKVTEANRMFIDVQSNKIKKLVKKETFVNDVLADDEHSADAKAINELHAELGVCVITRAQGNKKATPLTVFPVDATPETFSVSTVFAENILSLIGKTKRSNGSITPKEAMRQAVKLLSDAFPSNNYEALPGALWGGLSLLLYLREDLLKGNHNQNLTTFLAVQRQASPKMMRLTTAAKSLGGNALNKNDEATARGLAELMKETFNGNKAMYNYSAQTVKLLDIKQLATELGLK